LAQRQQQPPLAASVGWQRQVALKALYMVRELQKAHQLKDLTTQL
jgi:hypothetical protein